MTRVELWEVGTQSRISGLMLRPPAKNFGNTTRLKSLPDSAAALFSRPDHFPSFPVAGFLRLERVAAFGPNISLPSWVAAILLQPLCSTKS